MSFGCLGEPPTTRTLPGTETESLTAQQSKLFALARTYQFPAPNLPSETSRLSGNSNVDPYPCDLGAINKPDIKLSVHGQK